MQQSGRKTNGSAGMLARGRYQVTFWVTVEQKEAILDAAAWQGETLAGFSRRCVLAAAQLVAAQARETGSKPAPAGRKRPRAGKRLRSS